MPPLLALLPTIAAITGIAGTGVGLGLELSNQPGSPKPATPTPAQTTATADANKQNQLAALTQQEPNIQAATGGSLSPDAWAQLASILSGQAGSPGIGSSQQDLVTKLLTGNSGGTVTAGNNTGGGTPGSSGGLTNTTFG
jgi:hypothetical protein